MTKIVLKQAFERQKITKIYQKPQNIAKFDTQNPNFHYFSKN